MSVNVDVPVYCLQEKRELLVEECVAQELQASSLAML